MKSFERMLFRLTSLPVLLLLLSILLLGCTDTAIHPVDLLKKSLDAEMTVEANGIEYRVSVHLGAVIENGTRDCEICFFAPDSLAEITATEKNGVRTLAFGEQCEVLSDKAFEASDMGFFLPAALLSPCETAAREIRSENGKRLLSVRLTDGRILTIDPASGQLLSIRMGDITATLSWIETRERNEYNHE